MKTAEDLRVLARKYNSEVGEKFFDEASERFINRVEEEMLKVKKNNLWFKLLGGQHIGIALINVSKFLEDFSLEIDESWILSKTIKIDEFSEILMPIDKYVNCIIREKVKLKEISGVDPDKIPLIALFAKALVKKGFAGVYVDIDAERFVVMLDI